MKRVLVVIMCILPLLFLARCKFEGEFWVKKSGAGHGTLSISGLPMMTKSQPEAELGELLDLTTFCHFATGMS